MEEVNVLKCKP